jgi:cysteine desulfurase / selenocysteine lyase
MAELLDLIGNVEAFPVLKNWNFLNHAGVAPMPSAVGEAIRKSAAACEAGAYLGSDWFGELDQVHVEVARFIHADVEEVALVKNTSEAISIVAQGIDWKAGDRVVTAAVEYPANVYPWMEASRKHGIELVMVPEETDEQGRRQVRIEKILAELENPRTRVLTLSHVEFASGQRHDIARLGAVCRERGILFNVDGIQALGALPVDVVAMNIDFMGACGHKWMCGPPGAGLFYIRRGLLDRVRPLVIGASSVINDQDYGNYDFTLKPSARRYESGTPNLLGFFGFAAALKLLSEAGIDAIADRLKTLTDRFINGIELRGYRVVSPRAKGMWSGIVCFTSPAHSHDELVKRLRKEHRIEIALREGRLRCSPHFYNTEAQIDQVIEALPEH